MSISDKRSYRQCVRVVIFKDKRLLLGKKFIGGVFSYYEFPGGGIDDGETIQQAVIKECLEEVGIKVKNVTPLQGMHFKYEVNYPNPERAKLYRGGEDSWCICHFDKFDTSLYGSQNDTLPYTWETLDSTVRLIKAGPDNRFNAARLQVLDLIKQQNLLDKNPIYSNWK